MQILPRKEIMKGCSISHLFFGLAIIFTLISSVFFIYFQEKDFMLTELSPEIEKKSNIIGRTILNPIERALKLGLDIKKLRGVEDHFSAFINDNPEIIFLTLRDLSNNLLYHSTETNIPAAQPGEKGVFQAKIPLQKGDQIIGHLEMGINLHALKKENTSSLYITITILCVALLFAYEILMLLFRHHIIDPLNHLNKLMHRIKKGGYTENLKLSGHDEISVFSDALAQLSKKTVNLYHKVKSKGDIQSIIQEEDCGRIKGYVQSINEKYKFSIPLRRLNIESTNLIKIPIFLFTFAEAMINGFVVLYAKELHSEILGPLLNLAIILPVAFYMLAYALSHLLYSYCSDMTNKFHILTLGGLTYCLGTLGSALSYSLFDFIFWRIIAGLGFGFLIIFCLSIKIYNHKSPNFEQAFDIFSKSFYGACICGITLGALLASSAGFQFTLFVILSVALVATLVSYLMLRHAVLPNESQGFSLSPGLFQKVFAEKKQIAFLFLITMPNRMIISGCFLCAFPLYLASKGVHLYLIGALLTTYSAVVYCLGNRIAKLLDKLQNPLNLMIVGNLLASFSGVCLLFFDELVSLFAFAFLLGVGHSFSTLTQIMTADRLHIGSNRNINAFYRFLELLGLSGGAMIMGMLMMYMSPTIAINGMLLFHAILLIIFCLFFVRKINRVKTQVFYTQAI